jgi:divinyl protochlorophyllide a 8-vinyl-reductase
MAVATMDTASHRIGMIGPNAITRIVEALDQVESPQSIRRIFRASGLEMYLSQQPTDMVDEHEVMRLHHVLHDELGDRRARSVGRIAGHLTANYLLRCRIPRLAQIVLRCCPAGLASRALANAIARNAWTFVGTGAFSARHGRSTLFTIRDCPICRGQRSVEPYCDFYAATFERLYSVLVDKRALVTEIGCRAMGAPECTFEIVW